MGIHCRVLPILLLTHFVVCSRLALPCSRPCPCSCPAHGVLLPSRFCSSLDPRHTFRSQKLGLPASHPKVDTSILNPHFRPPGPIHSPRNSGRLRAAQRWIPQSLNPHFESHLCKFVVPELQVACEAPKGGHLRSNLAQSEEAHQHATLGLTEPLHVGTTSRGHEETFKIISKSVRRPT